MTDQNEKKYKQLALFSIITAEIVFTPCVLGGIAYWLSQGSSWKMGITVASALGGLCIGFYRVYKMSKAQSKEDANE